MRLLDLFSGIGGFHLGLEQAGFEFDWVGFSEIDKYAKATYSKNFPEAVDLGDVRTIQHEDLPKIDIITFGSPCQDFSIAGKRAGLDGNRSSLIGEAIRLIADTRPRIFLWENVKGTFSSNDGRDFWAIIKAFTDIGGYRLEWQLLNTRWFLPQNRERLYLVGCLGDGSGSKVFPIGENDESHFGSKTGAKSEAELCTTISTREGGRKENNFVIVENKLNQIGTIGKDSEATRVYDTTCARTIKDGGGLGAKTGLYQVGELKITAKKRSYDTPKEINEYLKANKNGKTIKQIAEGIDLPKTQVEHYFRSDKCRAIPSPEHWILLKELLGFDDTYDKQVTDIYEKEVEFESSRRVYAADGISKTIDTNETGLYQVDKLERKQDSYDFNSRVYSSDGIAKTLAGDGGNNDNKTGLYKIPEATKKGYAEAEEGDSINLSVPNSKTRRGRVGKGEAPTLDTGMQQYTIQPVLTPNRAEKRQNGRRFKEDGEDMFTLTGQDQHGVYITRDLRDNSKPGVSGSLRASRTLELEVPGTSIRRLTPTECERLQGFPDGWTEGQSDTQRYKQLGNAVSVPVVKAVARKMKKEKGA